MKDEGINARRGRTHGGDIHGTEMHMKGKTHTHKGTDPGREIHMDEIYDPYWGDIQGGDTTAQMKTFDLIGGQLSSYHIYQRCDIPSQAQTVIIKVFNSGLCRTNVFCNIYV